MGKLTPAALRNTAGAAIGIRFGSFNQSPHETETANRKPDTRDSPARARGNQGRNETTGRIDKPYNKAPSPTDLPTMPQDMPPRGGYEPVQYKVRSTEESVRIGEVGYGV